MGMNDSSGQTSYTMAVCPDCGKPYIYVGDVFGDLSNYICMCYRKPLSDVAGLKGWECPKCGCVMSPWVDSCNNCRPFPKFIYGDSTTPLVPNTEAGKCKACGWSTSEYIPVSCPDGRAGCCVMHYGKRCSVCGGEMND